MKTLAMDSPIKVRTEVKRATATCCAEAEYAQNDRRQVEYLRASPKRKKSDSAYAHKSAGEQLGYGIGVLGNGLEKLDAHQMNIACFLLPFHSCLNWRHAGRNQSRDYN